MGRKYETVRALRRFVAPGRCFANPVRPGEVLELRELLARAVVNRGDAEYVRIVPRMGGEAPRLVPPTEGEPSTRTPSQSIPGASVVAPGPEEAKVVFPSETKTEALPTCRGKKKDGSRCGMTQLDAEGLCRFHKGQAPRQENEHGVG